MYFFFHILRIQVFAAITGLCVALPWVLAGPAESVVRRRTPVLARRIFDVLCWIDRRWVLLFLFGAGLAVDMPTVSDSGAPVAYILRAHWLLYCVAGFTVWLSSLALRLSYIDEGGFRLETTARGMMEVHIHRRLTAASMKEFNVWLADVLPKCVDDGVLRVRMASHLIWEERRRTQLANMVRKYAVVERVELDRAFPMVPPTTISYWIRYGFRRDGRKGWRLVWPMIVQLCGNWRVLPWRRKRAIIIFLAAPRVDRPPVKV